MEDDPVLQDHSIDSVLYPKLTNKAEKYLPRYKYIILN